MRLSILALVVVSLLSCKETKKEMTPAMETTETAISEIKKSNYPEAMDKIFEAHGGLKNWRSKRSLSFEMPDKDAPETHTIDLYSRNGKIETPEFSMGYDGSDFWLLDEKEVYKGDPIFYHNLMFYFYAMPFVLADDGINFGETEPLEYEGKSYPGISIGYNAGVGTSPKDEYFIHYNPETFQMEWLGYTVTYRSGEKSDNVKWIRYDDWMEVGGVMLPKSITWFEYEGRTLKAPRNKVNFENVSLGDTAQPDSFFAKPDGAKVLEPKER